MILKPKREFAELEKITESLFLFGKRFGVTDEIVNTLNFAIEEIFTNLVKYNQDSKTAIEIEVKKVDDQIIICLKDFDSKPFDFNRFGKYDPEEKLGTRPVGKLGIFLVRKLMDDVNYKFKNKTSIITMRKKLENKNV